MKRALLLFAGFIMVVGGTVAVAAAPWSAWWTVGGKTLTPLSAKPAVCYSVDDFVLGEVTAAAFRVPTVRISRSPTPSRVSTRPRVQDYPGYNRQNNTYFNLPLWIIILSGNSGNANAEERPEPSCWTEVTFTCRRGWFVELGSDEEICGPRPVGLGYTPTYD